MITLVLPLLTLFFGWGGTGRRLPLALILVLAIVFVSALLWKRQEIWNAICAWVDRMTSRHGWLKTVRDQMSVFERGLGNQSGGLSRLFVAVFVLESVAVLTGVFEANLVLGVASSRVSLSTALVAEAATRFVNLAFAFVPLRIGAEEGGAALALVATGYAAAAGVTLSIIRKVRTIFWVAVGLFILLRHSLGITEKAEKSPITS